MNTNPIILYKYLNINGLAAFLEKGLSFSPVSNFKDSSEFSFESSEVNVSDFINKLMHSYNISNNDLNYSKQNSLSDSKRMVCNLINKLKLYNNDPTKTNKLQSLFDEYCNNIKQILRQSYAICCLTTEENNPKMWKEYADNGQGVMLELIIPKELCDESHAVEYQDILILKHSDLLDTKSFKKIIYNKNIKYKWENEIRIIIPYSFIDNCKQTSYIQEGQYIYDTNLPWYLKSISVGINCPPEDQEKIKQLHDSLVAHAHSLAARPNATFRID